MTRYLMPLLIGLIGTAILLSLGNWQVRRLAWKETVLHEIDTRLGEAPMDLPAVPDPDAHQFAPVALSLRPTGEALRVFASLKDLGVRYRHIEAMETADGRRILVELGTLSDRLLDVDAALPETLEVVGTLHWPDEVDGFTPDPDLTHGIWFARDLDAMAATLTTEPVLLVASEVSPRSAFIVPFPVDTSTIPNDHLQYAVTWYGLALVWVGMSGYWITRIARTRRLER